MRIKISLLSSLMFLLLLGSLFFLVSPQKANACASGGCTGICNWAYTYSGTYCSYINYPDTSCTAGCCTAVDGGWSGWSDPAGFPDGNGGTCSKACGTGTQSRTCTNPVPSCGGADCPPGASSQSCNTQVCYYTASINVYQDPSKTCSGSTAYPGATVTVSPALNGTSTFTTDGNGAIALTNITPGIPYTFTLGDINGYTVNDNCANSSNTINATFSSDNQTLNWYVSPPAPTCTITASPTIVNTQPPNNTSTLTTAVTETQPYSGNFTYTWTPDSVGGSLSPATTTTANKTVTTVWTAPNDYWGSGTTQPQAQVCIAGTGVCGGCQVGVSPSLGPPITIVAFHSISGFVYTDLNKNTQYNPSPDPADETYYTGKTLPVSICPNPSNPVQNNSFCPGGGGTAISTNSDGTFNTGANPVLPPGQYTVSLTDRPDSSYSYSGNSSYAITVGTPCQNEPTGISCDDTTGNVSNVAFGISNSNVWIQSIGADIYMGGGINYSNIPSNVPLACGGNHMSINQSPVTQMPGIIFTGNGTADFGAGDASSGNLNWVVGKNPYTNKVTLPQATSYAVITKSVQDAGVQIKDLSIKCTVNSCTLPVGLPSGVYSVNGDLKLIGVGTNNGQANTFPSNGNFTFLISGNLDIETEIHVPIGSTALFSAQKDITVGTSIGSNNYEDATPNIEGYYSTDQSFIVQGTNSCPTIDPRLNVAGAIVVNASGNGGNFQLQRDMCAHDVCPTFSIQARPDFVLNYPAYLVSPTRIWQEIAP